MLDKLEETENQVLDLVMEIDNEKAMTIQSGIIRLEKAMSVAGVAVCQWQGELEIRKANQLFFENLALSADASDEDVKQRIKETLFVEDLIRLKDEYARLFTQLGRTSWQGEFRQRLNNKTYWYRFVLNKDVSEAIPTFTTLCWNITKDKEMCQQLSHTEKTLREQNDRLSKMILEQGHDQAMVRYAEKEPSYLTDCNTYVWCWRVSEGLFEINFPSLTSVECVNPGVYMVDKIIDKIHPEDIEKIQLNSNAVNSQLEQNCFSIELRVNYDGAGYNWFEFRGVIVERDSNNAPILVRGVFLDIQERKQRETSLQEEIERLRTQEKKRSALFANLTQEMRTPLHAIIGFADLLAGVKNEVERLKYLDVIKNNNETLLNLIEGAIEYADIDQPEEELRKDSVCLWEYLVELHQIYSLKIPAGVKLMFSNSYDSRRIIIDKEKFADAIGILLNNVIQFTHSGYINYGYEFIEDKLILSLNDTSDEIAEKQLLEIFYSKDSSENTSVPKGYNLSLCKSLINKMGGSILVESVPEIGTTFTIELPLVFDKTALPVMAVEEKQEQKTIRSVPGEKQLPVVLVAEDTLYSFLMLKTLLEDRFKVVHAENGLHAVEMFRKTNPVFVFMDIKMPVMDGIEATRQIREISKEVPIVVLTAYAVRSLRKEAAEAGCTDMLTKPTSTKQINATIRKYLKKEN